MLQYFKWSLVLVMMVLTACGDEIQEIKDSQKEFIETRQKQWESYREDFGGQYSLSYEVRDSNQTTAQRITVAVSGNEIQSSSQSRQARTMDDFFTETLEILERDECQLKFQFAEEEPVFESFESTCEEEGAERVASVQDIQFLKLSNSSEPSSN